MNTTDGLLGTGAIGLVWKYDVGLTKSNTHTTVCLPGIGQNKQRLFLLHKFDNAAVNAYDKFPVIYSYDDQYRKYRTSAI